MIECLKSSKKTETCVIKLVSFVTLLTLSGCDSFRNTLGLDHYQPDEFQVSEHPPLSMPPNFNLRPPSSTPAPTTQASNVSTQQAQQTLMGKQGTLTSATAGKDNTSQTLVNRAAAGQAVDPNIRQVVNQEAASQANRTVLDDKLDEIKRNATSFGQEKKPASAGEDKKKTS